MSALALEDVVALLERIAPLELAEEWDNVGLLVEPPGRAAVKNIFLTVDLTEAVLEEALARKADLIVAYHPPWFRLKKRLTLGDPRQRILLRAIHGGVAIYSPHTAVDAAPGGVNDWLADGLGAGERRGLVLPRAPFALTAAAVTPGAVVGQGRELLLDRPVGLATLVKRIKRHLGLRRLRVGWAPRHRSAASAGRSARGAPIATIALCAGAGAQVLRNSRADLLLTGEMGHHDVLAAQARGSSVVLCEHSNTERGYLKVLRRRLLRELGKTATVFISRRDRDPLEMT